MNKLIQVIRYLVNDRPAIIKKYNPSQPLKKRLKPQEFTIPSGNVILTTYFTTKKDPQRSVFTENNDFNYIKEFYDSVLRQDLFAVIFYDSLSKEFIDQYTCKNIAFVEVELGPYSLNDERFYIYYEYIKITKPKKIIMADVNDVVFLKNDVFSSINKNKIYICKDENFKISGNKWIRNKIEILPLSIDSKTYSFWEMPIVNAGVIGGDHNCISNFILHLIYLFEKINNNNNNNMIVVNIVFHDLYWRKYVNTLSYKINHLKLKNWTNLIVDKRKIEHKKFNIGHPFTTAFKKEEINSDAFIKHK